MLKIPFLFILSCILSSPSLGAQNDDSSIDNLLTIHGSNTIGAQLAPALIKGYLKSLGADPVELIELGNNESRVQATLAKSGRDGVARALRHLLPSLHVKVDIAAHGSGTGFAALKSHQADIAAASRPAKQKEIDSLRELTHLTSEASEHVLAIDGLAIIVHPDNPIEQLSVQQVSALFAGEIRNWSQLGGVDGEVTLYARDHKSGTWDSFKRMVLGKSLLAPHAKRFESNNELSDQVSQDVHAIGFVGLPSVRQAKLLAISTETQLDNRVVKALKPTQLSVSTEDYALSRRLFLYTDDDSSNPYVKSFIDFALSEQGQNIVAENGFIAQNINVVEPENYFDLPADFRQLTETNQRLTLNFRFKQGSAKLDNRALRDIQRLVKFIEQNPDKKLVLIGFGDYKKNHERSKLLSKLRAMAVRRELVRQGVYPKANHGYGENMPVANNQVEAGRFKNRRVEVWLGKSEYSQL